MTLICAHRGASLDAPENTLRAFEEARRQGAAMIELDVQLSADDALIVFHDDTLGRCTDGEPAAIVGEQPWSRLAGLQAHRGLSGAEPGEDTRIPRLEAVLDWAKGAGMALNIELKTLPRGYPSLPGAVARAVRDAGLVDEVWLSSFDHPALLAAREVDARLRIAALLAERLVDPARYAREFLDAQAINPGVHLLGAGRRGGGSLDVECLEQAQERGLSTFVWTVNEPELGRALAAAGVTGIITDAPRTMAAALEE